MTTVDPYYSFYNHSNADNHNSRYDNDVNRYDMSYYYLIHSGNIEENDNI